MTRKILDLLIRIPLLNRLPFLKAYEAKLSFIRFCIVGGTCALIAFIIYYILTFWFDFWYVYSNAISFVVTAIINFFVNKLWTFGNKDIGKAVVNQATRFTYVAVSGLMLNSCLIFLAHDFFHIHKIISWIIATGLVTFWNYSLNRFWTFKSEKN